MLSIWDVNLGCCPNRVVIIPQGYLLEQRLGVSRSMYACWDDCLGFRAKLGCQESYTRVTDCSYGMLTYDVALE